jgi:hypothetical protein
LANDYFSFERKTYCLLDDCRFGLMGVYVVMYLGVLKTLLRAIFVFAFLLIAFSLAFHVLIPLMVYPDDPNFYLVWIERGTIAPFFGILIFLNS